MSDILFPTHLTKNERSSIVNKAIEKNITKSLKEDELLHKYLLAEYEIVHTLDRTLREVIQLDMDTTLSFKIVRAISAIEEVSTTALHARLSEISEEIKKLLAT